MQENTKYQGVRAAVRQSRQQLAALGSGFSSRIAAFRKHRSAPEQAVVAQEFHLLLVAWGIEDTAAIPRVIRGLRLRFPLFGFPSAAALTAAAWQQSPLALITACLVVPPCLLGIMTTAWRISILRQRRFLPFGRWLRHCVGLCRRRA